MPRNQEFEINIPEFNLPQLSQKMILGLLVLVLAIWLASGIYMVATDEAGVELRFGKISEVTGSGLNYHLPYPIETVETPRVAEVKRVEIGFRTVSAGPPARYQSVPQESLMLTGDENIIDINMIVQYKIKDAEDYLFKVREQSGTVQKAAEASLRQVVGTHNIDDALTDRKFEIQSEILASLQSILDLYQAGVVVIQVQLQDVHPPAQVIDAFKDVASALEDRSRLENQAQGYQNDIIPRARGRAEEIMRQAEGYKEERVLRAQGDSQRFLKMLTEYQKAPAVTEKRMYLETMEKILPGLQKYIAKVKDSEGLMPLLDMRTLRQQ
ncbi:MAG: FtsH protease activity modulator HflK [Candidatus Glassbacteria bacterium]|nr:FtsH protease activity modulator HflK [Candidatus Glassbacteria bacterium]